MQDIPEDQTRAERREFLKGLAIVGGAASLGAGAARTASAVPRSELAQESVQAATGEQPGGYRETEHIRAYYASTRS